MAAFRRLCNSLFSIFAFCFCWSTLTHSQTLVVYNEVKHDVSAPLRDLVKGAPLQRSAPPREAEPARMLPLPSGFKTPELPDPALQRTAPVGSLVSSPQVINNFDGIGQDVFNFSVPDAPPDTNGAVGLTQYVQWINVSFAIFDKTSGSILPNFPVSGNVLWSGFGGACESNNDGDPVVVYDKLNDRWVFGQFAVRAPFIGFLQNSLQCIAVSTTADATGTYNRYAFEFQNKFDDYPKMSVWPDAYYATFNMFDPNTLAFLGADACAMDGNAMRKGQPASIVCFQQATSVASVLPADVDGRTPPPNGSPNFMLYFGVNSLNLFKFHVDFATPANSTFTGPTTIPVAAFTPLICNNTLQCVQQPQPPGDGTLLDSLGDRLMHRLAYRNFGSHESLVVNHSVSVGSASGVRWYEIQNPNGSPVVAQQSTFAPDSKFRWMGSLAMDGSGDLALGYSVSGPNTFPSVAIAGQAAADPRNTLQAEIPVIAGTGAQTGGLTRWGDYSAMQVDPSDDCTFWYTTEYLKTTGAFNWNTRIVSFKFPGAGVTDLAIGSTHGADFHQGESSRTYTITVTAGCKDSDGSTVTVTDKLPAGLSAASMSGNGWTCTLSTLTCTRSGVLSANKAYPPITLTVNVGNNAPGSVTNVATVSGGGDQNPNNNTSNDVTAIDPSPDLTIAISHSPDPFTVAQTGTYTITVSNVGTVPTSGMVTVNDALPAGAMLITTNDPGWICSGFTSITCSRSDALAAGASYPPIALTLNVSGGTSPITNTVNVSGGGEFDTANDMASDRTTVLPVVIAPNESTNTVIKAGNSAFVNLTVTLSTGQTVGTVTFAASGLPSNSKATFSPTSLTQTGGTQLTIATSGNGVQASLSPNGYDGWRFYPVTLIVVTGLIALMMGWRRQQPKWALPARCIFVLALASLLGGCNGIFSPPVTPSGSYTIMVTANSSNSTVAPATTSVTLTVQ